MKKKILLLCLWMGTSLLLSAQNFSVSQTGQTTQKKIAVYVSGVLSDERNTALADNLMEAFAESDKYIAVNRSREVYDLMKKAQTIQQNGHIDITQVANFTKQFGEDQLCAVSVIKIDNTFVFRATIVELTTGVIIKSTSYKEYYNSYSNDNNIPYDVIYKASQKLIEGLLGKPKQATEPTPAPQPTKKSSNYHSDIAWGIAGAGYPWNLATSFNFRYGDIIGLGIYGDFGLAFTHINVEWNNSYAHTTATRLHYAAGAKFYCYKGLNVGCGYGSIHKPAATIQYNYGAKLSKDGAKTVQKKLEDNSHGLLIHAGYDFFYPEGEEVSFFLGFNAGVSIDFKNDKKVAPSLNLKLGISFCPEH